jgi:hypothetical protein
MENPRIKHPHRDIPYHHKLASLYHNMRLLFGWLADRKEKEGKKGCCLKGGCDSITVRQGG